jgi:hypothetical protein
VSRSTARSRRIQRGLASARAAAEPGATAARETGSVNPLALNSDADLVEHPEVKALRIAYGQGTRGVALTR